MDAYFDHATNTTVHEFNQEHYNDNAPYASYMIAILWLLFLSSVFVNLIILLNFLIAIITQRYDEVMMLSQSSKYQQRSELVIETEVTMKYIKSYWKKDTDESPVVIMRSLEDSEVQADEW